MFCYTVICGEPLFDEWDYQGVLYRTRGRDVSLAPILILRTHYGLRVVVQSAEVNIYAVIDSQLLTTCEPTIFFSPRDKENFSAINNLLSSIIILYLASRTLFGFLRSLVFHYMYYKPKAPHANCYPFNDFQVYMFICLYVFWLACFLLQKCTSNFRPFSIKNIFHSNVRLVR